ncbi:MAG: site-2 protease family protein [Gemmatimonadota bacterium]
MRLRFWRPELVPEPSIEETPAPHPAEAVAASWLDAPQVFRVGRERILRGWLRYGDPEGRARLDRALEPLDVAYFYERVDGRTRVTITHPKPPTVPPEWKWNLLGFVLTVISTLWAGAYLEGAPWDFFIEDPARVVTGVPFAGSLLGILAAHEFGHYIAARRYGLDVTLPFFIPMPILSPIGTLGAVIKMKTPIYTRRMLLDVGAAGPLAGIVVAIPVTIWGLLHSPIVALGEGVGIRLGEPLLFKALAATFAPAVPDRHDILLDSVAFAGWVGLFVTALNLLPIGQLDGGHVFYALLRRGQHVVGWAFFAAILVMGFWWPGWYLWAAILLVVVRVQHPPVLDPDTPLDAGRRAVGWLAVALFVACFAPVPFEIP